MTMDTLNHNFLLCKLKACDSNKNTSIFIQRYFTNRQQRTKMEDKFSKWQRISTGVPQGSILGPLFFNIFINDLFLFIETTTLCNYADDNTVYSSDKNSNIVICKHRHCFQIISEWFYENCIVLNPDKCHFLTLAFNQDVLLNRIEHEYICCDTNLVINGHF